MLSVRSVNGGLATTASNFVTFGGVGLAKHVSVIAQRIAVANLELGVLHLLGKAIALHARAGAALQAGPVRLHSTGERRWRNASAPSTPRTRVSSAGRRNCSLCATIVRTLVIEKPKMIDLLQTETRAANAAPAGRAQIS